MTHGIEYDVPAPIQFYDAVHAEVLRRVGTAVDGLLLHVARPSERGFRVLEVFTGEEPELVLAEVARRAILDNATTFRLLNTLVMLGYVQKVQREEIRQGVFCRPWSIASFAHRYNTASNDSTHTPLDKQPCPS